MQRTPSADLSLPLLPAWGAGATAIDDPALEIKDFSNPGPYLLRGFHGTQRQFARFDPAQGNPEGQFGAVIYFSTDAQEAWANYARDTGPDVSNKITNIYEQLSQDMQDDPEAFGLEDGATDEAINTAAMQRARQDILGADPQPRMLECALRCTNPFLIGGTKRWKIPGLLAWDEVGDDLDMPEDDDDEEAMDAWHEACDQAHQERIDHITQAFHEAAARARMIDPVQVPHALLDDRFDGTAEDLEAIFHKEMPYVYNEEGQLCCHDLFGHFVQALGFDAIVLLNAHQRFPKMGIAPGAAHVHLFAHTDLSIQVLEVHASCPAEPDLQRMAA